MLKKSLVCIGVLMLVACGGGKKEAFKALKEHGAKAGKAGFVDSMEFQMKAKGGMLTMRDRKTGKKVASGMLKQKIGGWLTKAKNGYDAASSYKVTFEDIKPVHASLVKNKKAWLDVFTALKAMADGAPVDAQMKKAIAHMNEVGASQKAFNAAWSAYVKKHKIKTY